MSREKETDLTVFHPETVRAGDLVRWRDQPAADPFLVILTGLEKGKKILLVSRCTTLGRSVECNVLIKDSRVSRNHAEVLREENAFWLVDMDSSNGTRVNGTKVTRRELRDGDRIMIGSTELMFSTPEPASPTAEK